MISLLRPALILACVTGFALSLFGCLPAEQSGSDLRNPKPIEQNLPPANFISPKPSVADICLRYGGKFSAQQRECDATHICRETSANNNRSCRQSFAEACRDIGAAFNVCASPCRHDKEARACIMSCVQTCAGF